MSKVTRLPTAKRRPVRNRIAMLDGSDGNVSVIDMPSRLPCPPERVLHAAKSVGLEQVLVVGIDPDGDLYFAGSVPERGETLLLLERAKMQLLAGLD